MPKPSYLPCRTYGHAWTEIDADKAPEHGVPFWLRCERCSTVRQDVCDRRDGALVSRRYIYDDAYKRSADEEPMTRNDFRLLLIRQRIAEARGRRMRAAS